MIERKPNWKEVFERSKQRNSKNGITREKFEFNNAQLSNYKDKLCEMEMSFEMFHTGSITKVVFEDGKKRKYGDITQKPGMHLPKLTNAVVQKRIDEGLYVPVNKDPYRFTSNTIMYNSQQIQKILFTPCVSVDIQSCYWTTARNLGVIDEKLYLRGMEKDREFKDARNISIGSIGSLTIHDKYEKGKRVLHELIRKPTACARLDIVDHVWAMANRIATVLGPDFLMFLTDCFFVPEGRKDDVKQILSEEGYKSKSERAVFTHLKRMRTGTDKNFFTEEVVWYLVDKEVYKLHDFSNKHNVSF